MSPELCKKKEYSGPASDTWAAGVLLYTLLFGTQPFKARTEVELFRLINKGQLHFPKSSHPDFATGAPQDPAPSTVRTRQRTASSAVDSRRLLLPLKAQKKKQSRCPSDAAKDRISFLNQRNPAASPTAALDPQHDPFSGAIYYSKAARDLILDLLEVDATKRIRASEVLHRYRSWFQSHDALLT